MTDYKYDFVKVRVRDGIAWAALNRPEKRNAMSPALSRNRDTGTFGRHEVALFRRSAGLITLSSCIGSAARSCPRDHIVVLAFRGNDGVRRMGKGASRRAHASKKE